MKRINYFLIAFIFGFFLLTLFIEPVIYKTEDRSPFSNQIPNINLNIPINENVEYDNFEAILEEKLSYNGRTEFTPAWTVKVKTYANEDNLLNDLVSLKKLGFKVYSRYQKSSSDRFDLYVGPTLIKKDSLEVLEKLKNLDGFDPKITQYD